MSQREETCPCTSRSPYISVELLVFWQRQLYKMLDNKMNNITSRVIVICDTTGGSGIGTFIAAFAHKHNDECWSMIGLPKRDDPFARIVSVLTKLRDMPTIFINLKSVTPECEILSSLRAIDAGMKACTYLPNKNEEFHGRNVVVFLEGTHDFTGLGDKLWSFYSISGIESCLSSISCELHSH